MTSIFRQSFCAAAHFLVQSGAWFSWSGTCAGQKQPRWQSNRSRSTGWHSPAVPPVRSTSQPGAKTVEHPSGMCGPAGCCGSLRERDHVRLSFRRARGSSAFASVGGALGESSAVRAAGLCVNWAEVLHRCLRRTGAETPGWPARSRRRLAGRCRSSRESSRSSAGSAARSCRSACAPRGSSRRRRAAAPSTSAQSVLLATWCDSRNARCASRSMPSRTVPSLWSSDPAKRWHSARRRPSRRRAGRSPRRTATPCSRPCGSRSSVSRTLLNP